MGSNYSRETSRFNRGKARPRNHYTNDEQGRALQLYQNITYDDIDLTGDEHTPPYLSLLAHTSVEDLIPFMQSHFPPLLTYPSLGSSPALSPGDRVVVVAGRFVRQSGFILQFMETISEGQTTLYAKVIPSDRGFYNPNQSGRAIYPKLSNLRRHALDFAYEFRCRDRVMFDRKLWHIESVDERSWTLSLSDSQASISGIPFDQVCRVWQTGDLVCVRWGPYANRSGYITRVYANGTLQNLDPNRYLPSSYPLWHTNPTFLSRAADVDVDVNDPMMGSAARSEAPYTS
ncbi:hypothetical protein R3P38DRAFT_1128063 [Favolaschia claudopus]|uniref:Uncharacterized protein n=1 Tax=Favolaschia claudopus TaxID=2862362 RepID=A0AAW0B698_9AGAR